MSEVSHPTREPDYRELFESGLGLYVVLYPDLTIAAVSDAYVEATGMRREEMLGKPILNLFSGEPGVTGAQSLAASLHRVLATGKPDCMPIQKYGMRRPAEQNRASILRCWSPKNTPILAADGSVEFIVHQVADVTESVYNLQSAVNEHSIISITDPSGIITYVNERFCALSKYSYEELVGTDHSIVKSGFHPKEYIANLWQTVQQGKVWRGEFRNRAKDGSFFWLDTTIVPFLDAAGKPYQYVAVRTDITSLKRAQVHDQWRSRILEGLASGASLHSVLELLTLAVEDEEPGTLCTVLLLDDEGKHLLCGAGPSIPEFYHRAIAGLEIGMGIGSCGTAAHTGQRVIVEDIQTHPFWAPYRGLAEKARLRSCWSEPIFSSKGQVLGTFAVYRRVPSTPTEGEMRQIKDAANLASIVIERKRAEEALIKAKEAAEIANQTKDQFIAVLSHELRTPLTPVLATVSALQSNEALPDPIRSALNLILRNVEMEVALIDDLLDVTRISQGKVDLHYQTVDVQDCVQIALETCQKEVKTKHLEIRSNFDASNTFVRADPTRLRQVFWNLLNNAVKFTPPGGVITLSSHNIGDELYVEVADTGIGIEPDVMPRLFRLFEQGERNKSRQFGGLGLGLYIAQAVVQQHGGRITASSEGRNKGAKFTVELRTVVPQAKPAPPPATAEPKIRPLRILLVEDHIDTLQVLVKLLQRWGHIVTPAGTIAEAQALLAAQEFELLISDIGLPDGSGLEIMRNLRGHSDILGIALSGYGTEEDIQKSKEAGFATHLLKPVGAPELRTAIQQCMLARV